MGAPKIEIDQGALEGAVNNALKNYFPRLEPTSNARVEFYNKFQREADEYDNDFLGKHKADLDTTLVFAGLFSAVASAFVVAVQTQLQPDYTQLSYNVLMIIADANGLKVPTKPASDSPWTGPDPILVHIQCVLFSSLATSLLSAFVAMLGKQWLNRYSKVDMRGSLIDRSRDRQRKINGMSTWGFKFVMETLPLMLQAALLLLGYALAIYLFTIDKMVGAVITAFTSAGLLFYGLITFAAILSFNCPFQTPFSLVVRFIICLIKEHPLYLDRSRKWLRRMSSQMKKQLRKNRPRSSATVNGHNHVELTMTGPFDHPLKFLEEDTNLEGYVLDSNCIAWMFEMSMDADVILNIVKFIPEVVWHADIRTTPLERLYDTVVECFDHSSDPPVVVPRFKEKAYLSAKALLHVAVQRKCMGNEFDDEVFQSISDRHRTIGYYEKEDWDLESTLRMIDQVFGAGDLEPIRWREIELTDSHRAWMGRILLYRALESLGKGGSLPDDIKEFVLHSLHMKRPLPAPIVTNCMLTISLVLGIKLHFDDQQGTDKSHRFRSQIDVIYKKLVALFENPGLTIHEINRALEAMKLIAPLSEEIATKSYDLFRVVMKAQVPQAYPEDGWEASRLAMHGAFGWGGVMPSVENPQDILIFLHHHLLPSGGNRDEPIQEALHALSSVTGPVMNEALKQFDSTQSSFVRGLCSAFQGNRPPQLRKAALLFLPLVADIWFNTPAPLMKPGEMKILCRDWASAVDDVRAMGGTNTNEIRQPALAVFFNMINSAYWRPHIVPGKWKLLKDFTSDPYDCEPLRRCLDNPELINAVPNAGNPAARNFWLAILWSKYEQLTPDVREKLATTTSKVSKTDLETCLSVLELELKKIEQALLKYNTWSKEAPAVALREKKSRLERAKESLMGFKGV